jgi:DNA-binding response OmpR family regulator
MRILVVDNEPAVREAVERRFAWRGMTCLTLVSI